MEKEDEEAEALLNGLGSEKKTVNKITKWLLQRGVFYLFICAIFYLIGLMLGIIPKPLENVVGWFANNFLLLTVLMISFMIFYVILTLNKRSHPNE